MTNFEIRDEFYLDGKPFKILSGAIQYFRLHPDQWRETLHNLKALGYNTVETYILSQSEKMRHKLRAKQIWLREQLGKEMDLDYAKNYIREHS